MARLVFSKIMDKYPKLKIITHHFGGIVPMLEGRIGPGWDQLGARTSDEDLGALLKQLKKRPLDYFKHSFYADTATFSAKAGDGMPASTSTISTRSCLPPTARSIRKRARCTRVKRSRIIEDVEICRRLTRTWSGTAISSASPARSWSSKQAEKAPTMTERKPVVIAGAGPTGLMCALALRKQDIPVVLLESEPALTHDLRAGSFHPPTQEMMAPYGITARMHETGLKVRHWQIRNKPGDLIAEFDLDLLKDVTPYPYRLHLEQHRLTPIQLDLLRAEGGAEIHFGHAVKSFAQRSDGVSVTVEADGEERTIRRRRG